jgi:hypothetical protein
LRGQACRTSAQRPHPLHLATCKRPTRYGTFSTTKGRRPIRVVPHLHDAERPTAQRDHVARFPVRNRGAERRRAGRRAERLGRFPHPALSRRYARSGASLDALSGRSSTIRIRRSVRILVALPENAERPAAAEGDRAPLRPSRLMRSLPSLGLRGVIATRVRKKVSTFARGTRSRGRRPSVPHVRRDDVDPPRRDVDAASVGRGA